MFLLLALFVPAAAQVCSDGTVQSHQKISDTEGGFTGTFEDVGNVNFGSAVASLGDLDGDGVPDLAVGAIHDDDGGASIGEHGVDQGAVWILFLNSDGTVKGHQKISATEGGFGGYAEMFRFGNKLTALGDLDGGGEPELAVGVYVDNDGGNDYGAVWILFLNSDGTVKGHQKISATQGGFSGEAGGQLDAVADLGDLDGDGLPELAVGARRDDDGGVHPDDKGAVYILDLQQSACPAT